MRPHISFAVSVSLAVLAVFALKDGAAARDVATTPCIAPGKTLVQPTALAPVVGPGLDEDAYPTTDGSTSAEPLGVWVAARLLGRNVVWALDQDLQRRLMPVKTGADIEDGLVLIPYISPGSKKPVLRLMKIGPEMLPAKSEMDNSLYEGIKHQGTHGAYKRLIMGEADLIYECRRPSPDEIKLMEERGVELEIAPIALDAFVFLRNRVNPLVNLASEQVRDIYTRADDVLHRGRLNNWKQVSGADAVINAYTRNPNSGSQETLKTLVMKDRDIIAGRDIMETMSMMGPYNRLYHDADGIGFTFYYYQEHMSPLASSLGVLAPAMKMESRESDEAGKSPVEMFAIDGVRPSRETIANGTYPWVTKVYAVTRKGLDPGHPAARLRDWLSTEEGQRVIAETGYVPLHSKSETP